MAEQQTPKRTYAATDLLRSMMSRAAHVTHKPARESIVTEMIDGLCVQCVGRPAWRRTIDGVQPTVSTHWFIGNRRSNKEEVYRRFGVETTGRAALQTTGGGKQ